jgi:DNA-binding GntR family transcriptional regulator
MEALACRRAAARAPADIGRLTPLVDEMDLAAGSGDVGAFNRLNIRFHEGLVELSGSRELAVAYRRLVGNLTLFRLRTLAVEGSLAESNAEHRRIVERLAACDAEGAARIMQDHIESSSRRTQHALQATRPAHHPREGDKR